MASTSTNISWADFSIFHSIDREVFSRLVITLMRDPAESLLLMALWLWLEQMGYPNIIVKMAELSDPLVNDLADEAGLSLKVLEFNTLPKLLDGGMPLTTRVMGKDISLSFFLQNKFIAINGIKNFLNTVCSRIFTDILERVLPAAPSPSMPIPNLRPMIVPGFPHPLFGNITIMPETVDCELPSNELWAWEPYNNITEDDRTMFLTFSRGFPVTKEEVTNLFTNNFGDCVVNVQMQDNTTANEQPLFAKIILRSTTTVDRVLNGQRIAKFRINGKHIWARKYERRDYQN